MHFNTLGTELENRVHSVLTVSIFQIRNEIWNWKERNALQVTFFYFAVTRFGKETWHSTPVKMAIAMAVGRKRQLWPTTMNKALCCEYTAFDRTQCRTEINWEVGNLKKRKGIKKVSRTKNG